MDIMKQKQFIPEDSHLEIVLLLLFWLLHFISFSCPLYPHDLLW